MELNNTVKVSGLPAVFEEKTVFDQLNIDGNLKSWKKGNGSILLEFAIKSDAEGVLCFDDFEVDFAGKEVAIRVNWAEASDLSQPTKAEEKQEPSSFNLVTETQLTAEQQSRIVFIGNLPNDYDDSKQKNLEGKFNQHKGLEKTFKGRNCYALLFKDATAAKDSHIFDGSELSEAGDAPSIVVRALEKGDLQLFESFRNSTSVSDQDEWVKVPDVDSDTRKNPTLDKSISDSIPEDITKSYPPAGPTEQRKQPQVPETKEEPTKPSVFNPFEEPEEVEEKPAKIEERKVVPEQVSAPVTKVQETIAEPTQPVQTKQDREEETPIDRSQPVVTDRIPKRPKQPETKAKETKTEEKPEKPEVVAEGEPLLEQVKRHVTDYVKFKDGQDMALKALQVILVLIFLRAVCVSGVFCK
jgi:hypothetical protein